MMDKYSHLDACTLIAEIIEGYAEENEEEAKRMDANALSNRIESAVYEQHLKPAIEFWKRRLGSEIQDLRLKEGLLCCYLKMYIAKFGTPSLQELFAAAEQRTENGDMA